MSVFGACCRSTEQKEGPGESLTSWHQEGFQAKSNIFAVPTLQSTIKGINTGKKKRIE